ncbi:glyoxalase-like protein [Kineococcus xinjiangensis]|uniref:Glyoxalase-like protein n=2 Tax=Kineococcus xinjiangensis TaxID=512762 RepID=A0A2S6IV30_9ACTN|nr:glyoxalase-like protein [Kineococcus xinjiangensis]
MSATIPGMRLDHVGYAAGREGLQATARHLADVLGVRMVDGGPHPRFGTRNVILPLSGRSYVEVVEVLDHPVADRAPFGRAVRRRSDAGGGWFTWCVGVDDITRFERLVGQRSEAGSRRRPDGVELHWRHIGIPGLLEDPQLPLLLQWDSPPALHPSGLALTDGTRLAGLEIAGTPDRIRTWLGLPPECAVEGLRFDWLPPGDEGPGLRAVVFEGPRGTVRI